MVHAEVETGKENRLVLIFFFSVVYYVWVRLDPQPEYRGPLLEVACRKRHCWVLWKQTVYDTVSWLVGMWSGCCSGVDVCFEGSGPESVSAKIRVLVGQGTRFRLHLF